MIDTIAIMLSRDMYTVIDHDRFTPSTRELYSRPNQLLGDNRFLTYVQNPTSYDKKNGIYKPRLTITIRKRRNFGHEINMKVELSVPKLLFGENFSEITDADLDRFLNKLKTVLASMGVIVSASKLSEANISSIHYGKNVVLTDYTTPNLYLLELNRLDVNGKLDVNQTDFRNGGHSWKVHANSYEIAFYDKRQDLERSKISDKRSIERDNYIQLDLFEKQTVMKPFEVLRMEARLNSRRKIKHTLDQVGVYVYPSLSGLFKQKIAQKVCLYFLHELTSGWFPIIAEADIDLGQVFLRLKTANPHVQPRKLLQLITAASIIKNSGASALRQMLQPSKPSVWYDLKRDLQSLNSPKPRVSPFMPIELALKTFTPLKLQDYMETV